VNVLGVPRRGRLDADRGVHLREPRDPGLHLEAAGERRVTDDEPLVIRRREGARADEAHVAHQHAEELRQLVDAVAAEHAAERGGPARVHVDLRRHRAQLVDAEGPSAPAEALLHEEDGAPVDDEDREREERGDGAERGQRGQQEREVEQALRALRRRAGHSFTPASRFVERSGENAAKRRMSGAARTARATTASIFMADLRCTHQTADRPRPDAA
jgi:hypothetical protein